MIAFLFSNPSLAQQGRPGYIGTIADRIGFRYAEIMESEESCKSYQENWVRTQYIISEDRIVDQYEGHNDGKTSANDQYFLKIAVDHEVTGISTPNTYKLIEMNVYGTKRLYDFFLWSFIKSDGSQNNQMNFIGSEDKYNTDCLTPNGRMVCAYKMHDVFIDLVVNQIPLFEGQTEFINALTCQAKLLYGISQVLEFDVQHEAAMKELAKKKLPHNG